MTNTPDLTAIYYTADVIPKNFAEDVLQNLKGVINGFPLIELHQEGERSHFNIYRQALKGAKMATTKYIAMCEDDVLYSPSHFEYRPRKAPFAYNLAVWSMFTWHEPTMFTHKGTVRQNLNALICDREAFIEAMEERFAKYPEPDQSIKAIWGEPGKYERQLGVTIQETEVFYSQPANIVFSHDKALGYEGLGSRKRAGEFRAFDIPYWGKAEKIRAMYG